MPNVNMTELKLAVNDSKFVALNCVLICKPCKPHIRKNCKNVVYVVDK